MRIRSALRDLRTVKQLLFAADAEASRDGEPAHGPEHLLVAALSLPDGSADRLLRGVGVGAEELRDAIASVRVEALRGLGVDSDHARRAAVGRERRNHGAMRATPQAQQVFQEAVELAKSSSPPVLQGAHVVAAACSLERGTVVRALAALGVDRDSLRSAARAEIGAG